MTVKIAFLLPLVTFIVHDKMAEAVTAAEMSTHITNTFNGYFSTIRPLTDQTQAVTISVDFYLVSINSFDNAESQLSTSGYLTVTWNDEILASQWSNANVDQMLVPQSYVWRPDLALRKGFDSLTGLGSNFIYVTVEKSGSKVTWKPYEAFESACSVDITYFPYDQTTCDFDFIIWANDNTRVSVSQGSVGFNLGDFQENSEYTVLSTSVQETTTGDKSGITFSITIKRRPIFYLIYIMLPVIMLAVLTVFVFVLPAASGEKTTFAVITFLSFALFLTIVGSELPQSSENVSIFGIYCIVMTFLSTVVVLLTIIQLRIHNRDEKQIISAFTETFVRTTRKIQCGGWCIGKGRFIPYTGEKQPLPDEDENLVTWPDVSNALDFVFFWIFLLVVGIATTVSMVVSAVAGNV